MNIGLKQKEVLDISKKLIKKNKISKREDVISSLTYFALWGLTPGFERIKFKLFGLKNIFKYSLAVLKDIAGLIYLEKIKILKNKNFNSKKYKKVIISRSGINNFDTKSDYEDRYFLINSKNEKKTLFLLLHSDEKKPKKISKNIVIFCFEKKKFNIYFLIKYLIKKLFKSKFLLSNFFIESSSFIRTGELINNFLKKEVDFKGINSILAPYEGQPYEDLIFKEAKKNNKKIITAGYDHSAPHAIPVHLMHKTFSPDILFLNGSSQIQFMNKFLKWPKKKLRLVPSLRYPKKMKQEFKNKVFLPYEIFNENVIVKDFEKILLNYYENDIKLLTIKNHPLMLKSKKHIKLKSKLEKIINIYKNKKNLKNCKKTAIFIGPTTGVIVALEKKLSVIHICFDAIFDSYSQKIWPNITVSKISNNSFIYKLNKRNTFINFAKSKNCYKKYYEIKK